MGIPLYKPKEEEEQAKGIFQSHDLLEIDERWRHFEPPPLNNTTVNYNNNNRRSPNRTTTSNRYHSGPTTAIDLAFGPPITYINRPRSQTRRQNLLLTSSLMDRRGSSRIQHYSSSSPSSSSPSSSSSTRRTIPPPPPPSSSSRSSLPIRSTAFQSEIDRRVHRCITEKENLLDQLVATMRLLDRFIDARESLGSNPLILPSYLTEDLPIFFASASSLATMASSLLSTTTRTSLPSETTSDESNGPVDVQHLVERYIRSPPYSTRINNLENRIAITHRRVTEQLNTLSSDASLRPLQLSSSPSLIESNSNPSLNPSITIQHISRPRPRPSFLQISDLIDD